MELSLDKQVADLSKFWMKMLSAVASNAGTSITELRTMDVFIFFSLLSVTDDKLSK